MLYYTSQGFVSIVSDGRHTPCRRHRIPGIAFGHKTVTHGPKLVRIDAWPKQGPVTTHEHLHHIYLCRDPHIHLDLLLTYLYLWIDIEIYIEAFIIMTAFLFCVYTYIYTQINIWFTDLYPQLSLLIVLCRCVSFLLAVVYMCHGPGGA